MSKDQKHDNSHWACLVCSHVFANERPVLLIAKNEGYPPEFMCGLNDHNGAKDGHVVGYYHLLEKDPSLLEYRDISDGFEYERISPDSSWEAKEL